MFKDFYHDALNSVKLSKLILLLETQSITCYSRFLMTSFMFGSSDRQFEQTSNNYIIRLTMKDSQRQDEPLTVGLIDQLSLAYYETVIDENFFDTDEKRLCFSQPKDVMTYLKDNFQSIKIGSNYLDDRFIYLEFDVDMRPIFLQTVSFSVQARRLALDDVELVKLRVSILEKKMRDHQPLPRNSRIDLLPIQRSQSQISDQRLNRSKAELKKLKNDILESPTISRMMAQEQRIISQRYSFREDTKEKNALFQQTGKQSKQMKRFEDNLIQKLNQIKSQLISPHNMVVGVTCRAIQNSKVPQVNLRNESQTGPQLQIFMPSHKVTQTVHYKIKVTKIFEGLWVGLGTENSFKELYMSKLEARNDIRCLEEPQDMLLTGRYFKKKTVSDKGSVSGPESRKEISEGSIIDIKFYVNQGRISWWLDNKFVCHSPIPTELMREPVFLMIGLVHFLDEIVLSLCD